MDDPVQDLEAELRQLRPRMPSAGLLAGLERELASPAAAGAARPPHHWASPLAGARWGLVWPVAAALLAFGGLAVVFRGPAGASKPAAPMAGAAGATEVATAPFKAVSATKFLYASLDEGPVMLSDGLPVRRVCNRYLDTYTWRNPLTRASVQWIVPRAEVRVVPVDAF